MLAPIISHVALLSPTIPSAPDESSIYVDSNTRIQVLDTMMDLPTADKEQLAAFIVGIFHGRLPLLPSISYCLTAG